MCGSLYFQALYEAVTGGEYEVKTDSKEAKDFLKWCLTRDPHERPSASELLTVKLYFWMVLLINGV